MKNLLITISTALGFFAGITQAADTSRTKAKSGDYVVTSSTKIDFDDTLIEGKMQAPSGFFLQGKTGQSLDQMVKLRANFKTELRNSKSGVSALAK